MTRKCKRSIALAAFTVLIAGAAMILPGTVESGRAGMPLSSDNAALLKCQNQTWPYLDRECIRDPRQASGTAQPARLVTADRIDLSIAPREPK